MHSGCARGYGDTVVKASFRSLMQSRSSASQMRSSHIICSPEMLSMSLLVIQANSNEAFTGLCVQNLPPAIFTLMKSTEPWMDEYYTFDLEEEMEKIGFIHVESILTDPRHRTVTGSVPLT